MSTAILVLASIIAPITTGVVGAVKATKKVPKTYMPLVAIIVGLALGALAAPVTEADIYARLWGGLLAGLGSVGLYEAGSQLNKK